MLSAEVACQDNRELGKDALDGLTSLLCELPSHHQLGALNARGLFALLELIRRAMGEVD